MRIRALAAAVVLLSLSIMFFSAPAKASYDGQIILDGRGDVRAYTIEERSASGHEEIDIISLETFERVARVEAYLTMKEDISPDFGYLYTVSVGGVTASYDNGTIMVTRSSDGEDLSDEVDVEIESNQMSMVVQKIIMEDGNLEINGSAVEYLLDSGSELTQENYYDVVKGEGSESVTPYQVSLKDSEGDVKFNFIEMGSGSDPDIDIIRMEANPRGDSIILKMYLEGTPFAEGSEEYTFVIGDSSYRYDPTSVRQMEGTFSTIEDHGISDNSVFIEVRGPVLEPGILVHGSSRIEEGEGGWQEDICPDRKDFQLDLFPFATGGIVDMSLSIDSTGEVEMSISTYDYDPALESLIVDSCDIDSSGNVDAAEVDSILDPLIEGLEKTPPISFGQGVEATIEYMHEGLTDGSELRITMRASMTIDLYMEDSIDVDISSFRSSLESIPEEDLQVDLFITLPADWEIMPLSISPEQLGNHLSLDKRTMEMNSKDPSAIDLMGGGINFEFRYDPEEEPQQDPVVYEDVPSWVYVLIGLVILGIAVIIIRFSWKREKPPEDI